MSFLMVGAAAISVGTGVAKAIGGAKEKKKAMAEAKKAQAEMDAQKDAFSKLDTSNPYANMENTMEDLTVNTQQAEFEAQQNQQNQANILSSMKGAAGGSGIAALAQTMANQGQLSAQKASASIGQQEATNQKAAAAQAGQNQQMERQGEVMSRNMERDKVSTLLGMAQGEKQAAEEKKAAANEQMMSGISSAASGIVGAVAPGGAMDALKGVGGGDVGSFANTIVSDTGNPMSATPDWLQSQFDETETDPNFLQNLNL
jgi:hypothetical protein